MGFPLHTGPEPELTEEESNEHLRLYELQLRAEKIGYVLGEIIAEDDPNETTIGYRYYLINHEYCEEYISGVGAHHRAELAITPWLAVDEGWIVRGSLDMVSELLTKLEVDEGQPT